MGKLFLLVEVADQIVQGALDADERLRKTEELAAADSGLWQHLAVPELPVVDLARLVGSVSDNWATNALLARVGLDQVKARAATLTVSETRLHDFVRDVRTAGAPVTLSEGTAADLVGLFGGLYSGSVVSHQVSSMVLDWTSTSVDLSMVASAFGLDPLSHQAADRGVRLWNKTGTDLGIRADVGVVEIHGEAVAYAAVCNWDEPHMGGSTRDRVLTTMRAIGELVRDEVS